jgi:hypothetical protein
MPSQGGPPWRSWREIARELAEEEDADRVLQLAQELDQALEKRDAEKMPGPARDWQMSYMTAMSEQDPQQRLSKIEQCERLIKSILRRLIEEGRSTSEERQELEEALHALRQRRNELQS